MGAMFVLGDLMICTKSCFVAMIVFLNCRGIRVSV